MKKILFIFIFMSGYSYSSMSVDQTSSGEEEGVGILVDTAALKSKYEFMKSALEQDKDLKKFFKGNRDLLSDCTSESSNYMDKYPADVLDDIEEDIYNDISLDETITTNQEKLNNLLEDIDDIRSNLFNSYRYFEKILKDSSFNVEEELSDELSQSVDTKYRDLFDNLDLLTSKLADLKLIIDN